MSLKILDDQYATFLLNRKVQSRAAYEWSYYLGKKVLITGAAGSIGSQLAMQLAAAGAQVILLDRDENALQETMLRLEASYRAELRTAAVQSNSDDYDCVLRNLHTVLVDIRDQKSLVKMFREFRPQIVLHAAALKHVNLLQQFPAEAWQTNVIGTYNVLRAAMLVGVETLVNISTDKAAAPVSVLGKTKLIAERLVAWAASRSEHKYLSVRFGNVLGSRGSLLPTLEHRIALGLPLVLRDPHATRYFMTVSEACGLVLDSALLDIAGKTAVLDMGEPVRIADLVHRVTLWHGINPKIITTELYAGEKLHEQVVGQTEKLYPTSCPKIFYTIVDPLAPKMLGQYRSDLLS